MILSKFNTLKVFIEKRPFVANCLNYGTLAGLAEFTQQTIEKQLGTQGPDAKTVVKYNIFSQ